MMTWTMREAAALTGASLVGDGEALVKGLSINTRTIQKGDLYVAIRGQRLDGHRFVVDALKKGAVGVLVDHPVPSAGRPVVVVQDTTIALGALGRSKRLQWNGPLAAVTGSVGKTTVKDLLACLLRALPVEGKRREVLSTRGNLNNCYGLPLTLMGLHDGVRAAVVELGINHPGEMALLAEIARPDVAVVTKVGDAHSGNFKGRAQVAKEKLAVLGSLRKNGTAVLNHDDPFLRKASHKGRTVWFGLQGGDVTARDVRLGSDTTSFTLVAGGRRYPTSVRLLGVHHVCNTLAAVAAAHEFGLSFEKAAAALRGFAPVSPMRMEMQTVRGIRIVNDAYNASPDSMKAALETFSAMPTKERKVAVVGDMLELGPQAPSAHRKVLEEALEAGVDVLVLVGQEMPKAWGFLFGLVPDLELGVEVVRASDGHRTTVRACSAAEAAGAFLKKFLRKGDVVLLKASRGVGLEKALEGL